MKHLFSYNLYSLICLLFLSACQKEEQEAIYNRTLLVYLARDNNLSGTSEEKKLAILEGWNGVGGQVVIYEDKQDEPPCLMEIQREKGENKLTVVQTYEEESSANTDVFKRVLRDMKELYPADSYGLIFFSHASGWLPGHTLVSPRSVGQDQTEVMELMEFAAAIPDQMFDFILFEACFMAGIEVAWELRDKTRLILASAAEIVSPGFKEIYATSMDLLFRKEPDVTGFAQKAFEYVDSRAGSFRSGTISVISTSGLGPLVNWLKTNISPEEPRESVAGFQPFERYYGLFFDFEEYFTERVGEEQKERLHQLIDECILYKAATPDFMATYQGFRINTHCGLTTYIPQTRYPFLNDEYKKLGWYKTLYGH